MKATPIEERASEEVNLVSGRLPDGQITEVATLPLGTPAKNYGFDVTPARLVTGLITERGICQANAASITELFPPIVEISDARAKRFAIKNHRPPEDRCR